MNPESKTAGRPRQALLEAQRAGDVMPWGSG